MPNTMFKNSWSIWFMVVIPPCLAAAAELASPQAKSHRTECMVDVPVFWPSTVLSTFRSRGVIMWVYRHPVTRNVTASAATMSFRVFMSVLLGKDEIDGTIIAQDFLQQGLTVGNLGETGIFVSTFQLAI